MKVRLHYFGSKEETSVSRGRAGVVKRAGLRGLFVNL